MASTDNQCRFCSHDLRAKIKVSIEKGKILVQRLFSTPAFGCCLVLMKSSDIVTLMLVFQIQGRSLILKLM
jgi:hypothetical protein